MECQESKSFNVLDSLVILIFRESSLTSAFAVIFFGNTTWIRQNDFFLTYFTVEVLKALIVPRA